MQLADIPSVVALEQVAYGEAWLHRDYQQELIHNQLAHYYILRGDEVVGVAGFWLMIDEVHVSTVAVHPNVRGLGLGEWLLLTLIEEGIKMDAQIATLEVRPSNHRARGLYTKYKFQQVGRRTAYYRNNSEDALILTTPPIVWQPYQTMLAQHKAELLERLAHIGVERLEVGSRK